MSAILNLPKASGPPARAGFTCHCPQVLDDFFAEEAAQRLTTKSALVREALLDYVRRRDPDRARQIVKAFEAERTRQ